LSTALSIPRKKLWRKTLKKTGKLVKRRSSFGAQLICLTTKRYLLKNSWILLIIAKANEMDVAQVLIIFVGQL
jgi:hypothetical protein